MDYKQKAGGVIMSFNITELFEESELTKKADGNFKVECPSCGSDGSQDYGGMILDPERNTAYCFNSRKWFTVKELFALQKKIITCSEGRTPKNG